MLKILLLFSAAAIISGCAAHSQTEIKTSEASSAEIVSQSEPALKADEYVRAEIVSPTLESCYSSNIEILEVYRFWENGEVYSHERVDFSQKEQNVLAVIDCAAEVLPYVDEPLPIKSVAIQKSYITVDFDESLIEKYSKGELFELQNTIGMTLFRNGLCDSVGFALEGNFDMLGGEAFPVRALAVVDADKEAFSAITAKIPYDGIDYTYNTVSAQEYYDLFGVELDETALKIARLLTFVGRINEKEADVSELNLPRTAYSCVQNTKCYYTNKNDESYMPSLIPIADSVSAKLGMAEDMFWIAEHVQKNAKFIFGDDFTLNLEQLDSFAKYKYFPDEGVITPPHMGGGYSVFPVVKDYEKTDEGYTAKVVYIYGSMGGTGPWGSDRNFTAGELKEYVKTTDKIAVVTVGTAEDGRLIFKSISNNL